MPKGKLLKRWNDWSAGIGHHIDDGETPGMYYATGLLGAIGELRAAPHIFTATESTAHYTNWIDAASKTWLAGGVGFIPSTGDRIEYDYDGVDSNSATATTVTISNFTTDSGSNNCLAVLACNDNATAISGITWDGDAMTKADDAAASTKNVSMWYKVAPGAKTGDIVATRGSSDNIAICAVTLHNVDQSTPVGTFASNSATGTNPTLALTGSAKGLDVNVVCNNSSNVTDVDAQQLIGSEGTGFWSDFAIQQALPFNYQPHYFFEEPATSDANVPFMYVARGSEANPVALVKGLHAMTVKVDMGNSNFGLVLGGGIAQNTGLPFQPGQPARYAGSWIIPSGDPSALGRQITTVGTGNISTDTIGGLVGSTNFGSDHFANIGSQLVGVVESKGVHILKVGGDPVTDADWGANFEVGDLEERSVGLRSLQGLTFVLNVEGLYSFNKSGGSGLVFEDFRVWRNIFRNLNMQAWHGSPRILTQSPHSC